MEEASSTGGEIKKKKMMKVMKKPPPPQLATSSTKKRKLQTKGCGPEEVHRGQGKRWKGGPREEEALTVLVDDDDEEEKGGKPSLVTTRPTPLPRKALENIANGVQAQCWQIEACQALFEEGNTIPFIARYRKERTGGE